MAAFAAGKTHNFKLKVVSGLLWRPAGADKPLTLVVIAPLSYRPSKKSKVLYRKPAYLVCTDPGVPLEKIIRAYVWRWEIEVNFRDEKQLIGLGEAQVWNGNSVENDPAFVAAVYAMLLLAGLKAFPQQKNSLPPPKWRKKQKPRLSTQYLINQLRAELWGKAIGYERARENKNVKEINEMETKRMGQDNFWGFRESQLAAQNPQKLNPHYPPLYYMPRHNAIFENVPLLTDIKRAKHEVQASCLHGFNRESEFHRVDSDGRLPPIDTPII